MKLLYFALKAYEIILLIRIVMSWIRPDPLHPFVKFIHDVTEPVLGPIRRMLPIQGFGFDFSPIIVFVILQLLEKMFLPYSYHGF